MNAEKKILRSFETVMEMMLDRGSVRAEQLPDLRQRFSRMLSQQECIPATTMLTIEVGPALVIYALQPKQQRITDMKKKVEATSSAVGPDHDPIIVVSLNLTDTNMASLIRSISAAWIAGGGRKPLFQHFRVHELAYNITRHRLVPKHEVVKDAAEVSAILQTHSIKSKTQMPAISRNDPMSKYLGARPGEIVRIVRPSRQTIWTTVYRVVV